MFRISSPDLQRFSISVLRSKPTHSFLKTKKKNFFWFFGNFIAFPLEVSWARRLTPVVPVQSFKVVNLEEFVDCYVLLSCLGQTYIIFELKVKGNSMGSVTQLMHYLWTGAARPRFQFLGVLWSCQLSLPSLVFVWPSTKYSSVLSCLE